MSSRHGRRWNRHGYRAGLWLCPPTFRREYSGEMLRDFDDALAEVAAGRRRDRWRVRLQMTVDLLRTAVVQWTRTGLPIIGIVAMSLPLVLFGVLATLAQRAAFHIPDNLADAELVGLLLLTITTVMLAVTIVVITLWAAPVRRTRRPR